MKICHSFSIFSFWSLILHKMHQKHGKWIFHHWNKGEMLKITWNMVKYCRILPFFLFFPRLNFNKMHQKQERMDFLSPKEEKNAENCKKMQKNGQKTRKIPIFSLFLLLFSLLPPFPPSFPFLPPPSSPLSPFFGPMDKASASYAGDCGFESRRRLLLLWFFFCNKTSNFETSQSLTIFYIFNVMEILFSLIVSKEMLNSV